MGYSVVIRTLGTGGEKYAQLMRGLAVIEPQPERVVVYIAEGYERPTETYGKEEYVWVQKGMAAQRLLPYDEIDSKYLLMLDDDVVLAPDSIRHLLMLMERYNADCIGIDTFANHKLPLASKCFAALTHWVMPHYSKKWAIKVHASGAFSYNNHPTLEFYLAQSAAGPASFWRTKALKALEIEEELWLDDLGFAYGDDMVLFYKLCRNGGKMGYTYGSGIKHLDGATASKGFKQSSQRAYIRAKASLAVWHRAIYGPSRWKAAVAGAFCLQWGWVSLITVLGSVATMKLGLAKQHFLGLRDGWRYVHSDRYRGLKPYVIGKHHGGTENTEMRILHVITSLRSGGAERLLTELLPRLRGDGREVEVLVMDGTETDFMSQLREQGIRVRALAHGYRQMRNPLLVVKLRRVLRGYDIVHTHNTACQLLVAMAAHKGQVLVTTEHNATNRRRGHGWLRRADRWMYSRYGMVVCVSESTERALREWCPEAKTCVIANGIDLEKFSNLMLNNLMLNMENMGKGISQISHIQHGKEFVVVMVAGFRRQKDHATALRAMTMVPEGVELWLAGEGETMEEMKALAQELGVMDRVKWLGRCDDIPVLLRQSDIALLSSHYEGQPMSLIEAMATGLPVVASDVAGIHDTVGDAGILVQHGDAEALAEAICRLAKSEELRKELSERSIRRAAEFSIDRTAEGYLEIYTTEARRARRNYSGSGNRDAIGGEH